MQQQSERDLLNSKLDGLDGTDLAPAWDRDMAWTKLETRLAASNRRVLPRWIYVSAAAAILVLGIFLFNQQPSQPVRIAQQPAHPPASLLKQMNRLAIPIAPTPAQQQAITKAPGIEKRTKTQAASTQPIANLQTDVAIKILPIPVEKIAPADTLAVATTKIKRTFTEPVYTLSEIMDNVPEHEEKPRNYSGIFNLRPSEPQTMQSSPTNSRFFPQRSQQQAAFNN